VVRVTAENVIADFEHPAWRQAAEALVGAAEGAREAIVATLPRELRDRIALRLLGEVHDEDRERALADCIARIRQRRQRRGLVHLREQLSAAESRGDEAAAERLKRELRQLMATDHTDKVTT
jgi:hypothetical protein